MKHIRHIAILGGAFNPITVGHIETANFVLANLPDIDEVWITPTYKHVYSKDVVDAKHRILMCEAAAKLRRDNRIKVFEYEINNKLENGTLDFITHLQKNKRYSELYFYFIIGMDNANEIYKWRNWEQLIKFANFIVINRPGIERDITQDWYTKYPHIYLNKKQTNLIEVSSTQVRTLLSQCHTTKEANDLLELKKYLNPKVLQYILKNKLYLQHEKHTKILQ